jgi:hypothetical protein
VRCYFPRPAPSQAGGPAAARKKNPSCSGIAQSVEQRTVNPWVVSSSLTAGAIFREFSQPPLGRFFVSRCLDSNSSEQQPSTRLYHRRVRMLWSHLSGSGPSPKRLEITLLTAYAAVVVLLTLRHEPWRDEADAWLVARDLPLSELVPWTRHAGTPFLWYLLLLPFARLGAPYGSMRFVHLVIALAVAALFVTKAPFSLFTKALFFFSFYGLYQYPVIARSYSLGILLTFILVALYARRDRYILAYAVIVGLLFNVNAHSIAPAGAATALHAFETVRRPSSRSFAALLIMLLGLAASFWQLYTPGYLVPPNVVSAPDMRAAIDAISQGFLPHFSRPIAVPWAFGFLLLLIAATWRTFAGFMLVSTLGGLFLIFTFLWIGGYRHFGLALIAALATLWLAGTIRSGSRANRLAIAMLNVSLVLSVPLAIEFASSDFLRNYSGSGEMARWIRASGLETMPIAAHPPAQTEAVLPYLARRTFVYPALGREGSHMWWDADYRKAQNMSVDNAAASAAAWFGGHGWLFLTAAPLHEPEAHGLRLLYRTAEPLVEPRDAERRANDERYWLYASREVAK